MAEENNSGAASTAKKPRMVEMPRAVHELRSGKAGDEVIEAGTIIDEEMAKKHKLTAPVMKDLVDRGAVEMAEVLTA